MKKLLAIALPPGFAYIRSSIRLTMAAALWLAGYEQIAIVVAVLAVISFFATIEVQFAKAIAGKFIPADAMTTRLKEQLAAKQAIIDRQKQAIDVRNERIEKLKAGKEAA